MAVTVIETDTFYLTYVHVCRSNTVILVLLLLHSTT